MLVGFIVERDKGLDGWSRVDLGAGFQCLSLQDFLLPMNETDAKGCCNAQRSSAQILNSVVGSAWGGVTQLTKPACPGRGHQPPPDLW
jgi:hypothetical protein